MVCLCRRWAHIPTPQNVVLSKKQEDLLIRVAALEHELSEKVSAVEQLSQTVAALTQEVPCRCMLLFEGTSHPPSPGQGELGAMGR